MRLIEDKARQLINKHGTADPFRLCELLGVKVFYCNLPGRGMYYVHKRIPMIFIDEKLTGVPKELVCAHELGHHVLHKGMNRIFFDCNTLFKDERYEIEADYFSTLLLRKLYHDL